MTFVPWVSSNRGVSLGTTVESTPAVAELAPGDGIATERSVKWILDRRA
jgi:hypothetical protein